MALLCLLALAICELLPSLESARVKRGIAHEVQGSPHPEAAHMTVSAYDKNLVACEESVMKDRFIIHSKDKPFVDYIYAAPEPSQIKCKTFTEPPRPSSLLSNLTSHTLPEDVLDTIASNFQDMRCDSCFLHRFNMTFLEKCRSAMFRTQWAQVQQEVMDEGGSCQSHTVWKQGSVLMCMASSKANQVAVCSLSDQHNLSMIKEKEKDIRKSQGAVEMSHRTLESLQGQIEFEERHMKKKQSHIKELKDALDVHKQNIVYIKQIFEGS